MNGAGWEDNLLYRTAVRAWVSLNSSTPKSIWRTWLCRTRLRMPAKRRWKARTRPKRKEVSARPAKWATNLLIFQVPFLTVFLNRFWVIKRWHMVESMLTSLPVLVTSGFIEQWLMKLDWARILELFGHIVLTSREVFQLIDWIWSNEGADGANSLCKFSWNVAARVWNNWFKLLKQNLRNRLGASAQLGVVHSCPLRNRAPKI